MWLSRKSRHRKTLRTELFSLVPFLVLFFAGLSCAGESSTTERTGGKAIPEEKKIETLLPAPGEAGEWERSGQSKSFRGERLFDHINGGADIYFEYGFVTLVTKPYRKGDKNVFVEVYSMTDPAAAFGIYSYNRHPTLSPVDVGSGGTIHQNGLFFWQNHYYVDIRQTGAATISAAEFVEIAEALENGIGAKAALPDIMGRLPEESKVPNSEVFARGKLGINNQVYIASEDLFGLQNGESAAIARYRIGRPECSVVIAQYKDNESAARAFLRFREQFPGTESAKEEAFVTTPVAGKAHAVRKLDDKLVVVANADGRENALTMLGRLSPPSEGASR